MLMGKTKNLNGRSKAAIIAISLGTEAAASVFKHLKDDEIEQLILEISRIGSVDPSDSEKAMEEFYELCLAQKYITEGGIEFAREVLEKAFGSSGANNIIDKISNSMKLRAFEFIRRIEPQYLLGFIQNEHPQTIALVLSYARVEQASHIISLLPKEKQLDIVERIATLDRTSPETIRDVEASLEKKLSSVFSDQFMEAGGIKNVAEILNHVDRGTEKFISEELFKRNQTLAEEIRKNMFVFEDIVNLDEMSIQRVLRDINTKDLTIALKGSNSETQEIIFGNLSTRLRDTVREEMQYLRGIRVRDVDEAQQRIVDTVRKLEEEGEITIQRGGNDNVLI